MKMKTRAGRGFTLLELMIVLAIIGIMTTMGLFTYLSQVQKIKLQNDVREINSTLQVARMRALATGIGHGVAFVDSGRTYFIFVDCNNDGEFTNPDGDWTNNTPVTTAEACAAASQDPRMAGENFRQLNVNNTISAIPGTETFITFNNLGQTVQGTSPVFGDFILHNAPKAPWGSGSGAQLTVTQSLIHINASGLTEVIPAKQVDYP